MKVMIVGDSHGGMSSYRHKGNALVQKLNKAGELKINHVLVVGDFGLWTHKADGQEFLDSTNAAAEANNLSVYAIGGNHENWDHWEWFCENMPTSKGFAMARRRVLLAPKFHHWHWAGKQFVGAGGAVSVDKDMRLREESGSADEWGKKRPRAPRTLWWPNEEFTDSDVNRLRAWGGKADYLITHDCSNYTHFQGRLKPDPDSERHRRRIDDVIRATEPKTHFHGHMHTKYQWENVLSHGCSAFSNEPWTGPVTMTYGLKCNDESDSYGILDVEANTFVWESDLEKNDIPGLDFE